MEQQFINDIRDRLMVQREAILSKTLRSTDNDLWVSSDDKGDEGDLASAEIRQSLVTKLRDRERVFLSKIDGALGKIERGEYGICHECEELIEMKRLIARPITTLCLACKEGEERREKLYAQF